MTLAVLKVTDFRKYMSDQNISDASVKDQKETILIKNSLNHLESVCFVQVGSNDGRQGDPIHSLVVNNNNWNGLFIEPVPGIYKRLCENYMKCPEWEHRFIFENIAIGSKSEMTSFYHVSEQAKRDLGNRLPFWYDQLGSFDRNHIVKHLDGILEPYIVESKVHSYPLMEVMTRNNIERIDLLHIDAEGFDYQVLCQFDFVKYSPTVVLIEHLHMSHEQRMEVAEILKGNNYSIQNVGHDFLAIKKS